MNEGTPFVIHSETMYNGDRRRETGDRITQGPKSKVKKSKSRKVRKLIRAERQGSRGAVVRRREYLILR